MKKKKLNSKNPKYSDKSQLNEEPFLFKQSYAMIRTSDGKPTSKKAKVRAIWY